MNRARIEQRRRAARAAQRWRWGWLATGIVVAVLATTIGVLRLTSHSNVTAGSAMPTVGQLAPDGGFTTRTGTSSTVASLRGQPVLLWFVVTSCPSVQASMPVMTQRMAAFRTAKVKVVVVEAYQNLGLPGPNLAEFGRTVAGANYTDPDWTFGTSSSRLTQTYDAGGYPDIYYLLDSAGRVQLIDSAPGSTMDYLLSRVSTLA